MRPLTITQTGVGDTGAIPLDIYRNPFNVTIQCVPSGGAAVYTVQYTLDDVYAPGYNPAAGNWFTLAGLSALSASAIDSLISPVTAIRLRVTAAPGGENVQMRVVQAGLPS